MKAAGAAPRRENPMTTTESKVMMLTGCASGIAKALAGELYTLGHRLLLSDLDEQKLATVAQHAGWLGSDRVMLVELDVRSPTEWQSAIAACVERWGRIDVLFNIAGCLEAAWVHEATDRAVDLMIDVNTKGVIHGTRYAAKRMIEQGEGHIVNIASMAGIAAVPGNAIYCASKHAVRGFSLSAAIELVERNVFVSVVCPGAVATPMLDVQIDREEAALTFSSARPLTPQQVVRAVIERVLPQRPIELVLPAGPGQGAVSKLSNAFPSLGPRFISIARKMSRANQTRLQEERKRPDSSDA
jgi:3-oxoacyl-[acyl-carrier protein] reductase